MHAQGSPVAVGVGPLSFEEVVSVVRAGAGVRLTDEARAAIERARAVVDELAAAPTPAYGISTGFGALATRHIPTEMRAQLQKSLIRSHAAGSGPSVEREVVRGLMLLRLSTLATGRTGVRPELAELMVAVLNAGITPVVHEYGSLGCSGDLAPLSHCALALMGEGEVHDADGVLMPAAQALEAAGLAPIELVAKEGLALINGTDGMLGMLVMALGDLDDPDAYGGRRRRHVGGGPAGHGPGVRPGAAGDPAAPGPGSLGRQPDRDPEGLGSRRLPPGAGLQPRAGCLLAALLSPGARGRARHPRPLRHGRGS